MATKYTLKKGQPPFEAVDGPMAGRLFEPGREYNEIPENLAALFKKVKVVPAKTPATKGDKK